MAKVGAEWPGVNVGFRIESAGRLPQALGS
jgi:hypothetical protein